jgi:hypothetical protein
MLKLAHIINPFHARPGSEAAWAQPITFESMRVARDFCAGRIDVTLYSAQYEHDRTAVPEGLTLTSDLDRSVLDMANFEVERPLPLLRDILDRAYICAPQADYLIYTNTDIGLQPNFYISIARIIERMGYEAFAINRRSIPEVYRDVADLPLMWAEDGVPHSGYDCFVFKRELWSQYDPGDVCVGAAYVGRALLLSMAYQGAKFRVFENALLTFHIGGNGEWLQPALQDYMDYNWSCLKVQVARVEAEHGTMSAERRAFWLEQWADRVWYDTAPSDACLPNVAPDYEQRRLRVLQARSQQRQHSLLWRIFYKLRHMLRATK